MKIVLEFDSFEDMEAFAAKMLAKGPVVQVTEAPVREAAPEPEEPAVTAMPEPAPEPEGEAYTMADVRAYLAGLRKAGKKTEVTALLKEMGADKFTDIPEESYAELMRKAREI